MSHDLPGAIVMNPHPDELALERRFPDATPAEMALWDAVFAAVASSADNSTKAHRMANAAIECRRKTFT
jgi:hypothetical protein